jgi:hypothetical protein
VPWPGAQSCASVPAEIDYGPGRGQSPARPAQGFAEPAGRWHGSPDAAGQPRRLEPQWGRLAAVTVAVRLVCDGPTHGDPGYTLAGGYELATLEQEILTAIVEETMITVMLEESLTGKGSWR